MTTFTKNELDELTKRIKDVLDRMPQASPELATLHGVISRQVEHMARTFIAGATVEESSFVIAPPAR